MKFLIIALLISICYSQSQTPSPTPTPSPLTTSNGIFWQGSWSNHAYGGTLYICQQGRQIYGVFSEVGWISGAVAGNGNAVSGTWGIGGFTDDSWGTFNWTLNSNRRSFSGIYSYNVINCQARNWSPTGSDEIISNIQPDVSLCQPAFGASSISSSGYTSSSNGTSVSVNLCIDSNSNTYAGSYTINGVSGAISGRVEENGLALHGDYIDATGSGFGIEFWRSTSSGIYLNRYPGVSSYADLNAFNFTNSGVSYLLSSSSSSSSSTCLTNRNLFPYWIGAFTDIDFGYGRTYFCQSGSNVWGVYSEVGYIEGIIQSNNTLVGRFYDAGEPSTSTGKGNFTLTLSDDGNSVSGSWIFDGETQTYDWEDVRVSVEQPTALQCATAPTNNPNNQTLQGVWYYQVSQGVNITTDLCINFNTGTYEYSYSSSSSIIQGYGLGFVEDGGILLRGEWYQPTNQGVEFFRLVNDTNTMVNELWPFNDLQDVQYLPCDGASTNNYFTLHEVIIYNRINSSPQAARCARNSFLSVGVPDPSPNPSGPSKSPGISFSNAPIPTSSEASNDVAFLATLVIAFVLFVVFF